VLQVTGVHATFAKMNDEVLKITLADEVRVAGDSRPARCAVANAFYAHSYHSRVDAVILLM